MATEDRRKVINSAEATLFDPQLVIGLGTGRCGTDSLAHLLDAQAGADVTHEIFKHKLPWQHGEKRIDKFLQWMKLQTDQRLVGDVAFAYLPYVGYILSRWPNAKFVCLQRDRTATIASFLKKTPERNHWLEHDGGQWQADQWDVCFPKYTAASKAEAIAFYWDEYYAIAGELQEIYPAAFRIFPTSALNQPEGQRAILYFLGIARSQMRLPALLHYNRSEPAPRQAQAPVVPPVVSVLMTVHNGARSVEETIISLLNQCFTAFELIIVDDGSTDATGQILATYATLDERIKLLHHPEAGGESLAYNHALSIACGRYLAISAADRLSLPQRLQKQVAFLDQHPEIGVLGAQLAYRTAPNHLENMGKPLATSLLAWRLLFCSPLAHDTLMLRRDLLQQTGGYASEQPAAFAYDLYIRLSGLTQLANLPERLVYTRLGDHRIPMGPPAHQTIADQMMQTAQHTLLGAAPRLDDVVALRRLLACEQLASSTQVWRAMHLLRRLHRAYLRTATLDATEKRQLAHEVAGHFAAFSLGHLRRAPRAALYGVCQWLLLRRQVPTMQMLKRVMNR